ncbi:MAG: GTP cyclohydrolase I FolE [Parachlamydiaceae bacterium]|nr:GTP cyclohydrolase I FolE [Parachlamydiaceae bacterium]
MPKVPHSNNSVKIPLYEKDSLEDFFYKMLNHISEDSKRAGLVGTPKRAAKAFEFLTAGYELDLETLANGAIFPCESVGMVIVKDTEMYSLCEHHMLPFFGKCHIAYLPDKYILGLSKFARIVDMFSRRLQVQENLTEQIAKAISELIKPKGVCVIMEAQHMCMMMRGIEKQHAITTTISHLGLFDTDKEYIKQFFSLLRRHT